MSEAYRPTSSDATEITGAFFQDFNRLVDQWAPHLTRLELCVLLEYFRLANRTNGHAFRAIEDLAEKYKVTRRAISQAIAGLKKRGFISTAKSEYRGRGYVPNRTIRIPEKVEAGLQPSSEKVEVLPHKRLKSDSTKVEAGLHTQHKTQHKTQHTSSGAKPGDDEGGKIWKDAELIRQPTESQRAELQAMIGSRGIENVQQAAKTTAANLQKRHPTPFLKYLGQTLDSMAEDARANATRCQRRKREPMSHEPHEQPNAPECEPRAPPTGQMGAGRSFFRQAP